MDPRKRLQVLQQNNPSIRVASAPQPQVSINTQPQPQINIKPPTAPQPTISVSKPSATPVFQPVSNVQPKPKSNLQKIGGLAKDVAGFVPRFALNYAQAFGNLGAKAAGGKQKSTQEFYKDSLGLDKLASGVDANGKVSQLGADAGQILLSSLAGGAGTKIASKVVAPLAAKGITGLGGQVVSNAIGEGISGAATGGAFNLLSQEAQGNLTKDNAAQSFGQGTLFGGLLGGVAGAAGPLAGAAAGKLKGFFKGNPADVGLDAKAIKSLKKTDSTSAVYDFLRNHAGRDGADILDAAEKIATSKSSKEITNIIGEVIQHAPEGAVGTALVKGTLDEVAKAKLKPKEETLPSTPQEPLPLDTGDGATINTGAKLDLPEEDLAAIKEAGGKLPAESNTTMHLPEKGVYAKLNETQASHLKNEVANLKSGAGDIVHLSAKTPALERGAKEVSLEELTAASPNAKASIDNIPPEHIEAIKEAGGEVPSAANPVKTEADVVAGREVQSGTTDNATVGTDNPQPATDARQSVLDSLQEASDSYRDNSKVVSKEKGQRIGRAKGSYEAAGGGEAGVRAKLGALKGKYTEGKYQPIDALPEHKNSLYDEVEHNPNLQDFERLNAQTALAKVFGDIDGKPTPSDIRNIRTALGDDIADAVADNVAAAGKTTGEKVAAIAATPKAAMATADLSAPLRQGAVLGSRFPKEFASNSRDMVKYLKGENYTKAMKEITERPSYDIMKKAKLAVDGADGITGTEEQFMSSLLETDVAKKAGVGHIAAASDRAYTGFLTKFRADAFDHVLTNSKKAGVELDDKALEALAEFINSASGRGNLGSLEKHAGLLSKALFSPRLWKSRLDLLNPVYYGKLDPEARKLALQSSASFATVAASVLGLAHLAGAETIMDPRSADFAKIKIGNTRYDILGGLQQNIRLGAQLFTGQKINSSTGELQTLGDGITTPDRADLLYQFFENKENPLVGYATKLLHGKDSGGNPINPLTEGAKLLIPLNAQSAYETSKDIGSATTGTALASPGIFGIGVQTYGNVKSKDKGSNGEYTGKVEENMVKGPDGKVILNDKGQPVTVKFPKDATSLEKKALLDQKATSVVNDKFVKSQSGEDQSLMKLSDTKLKEYVSDGTIDQSKYDHIQRLQKGAQDYGKNIKVPDGATSAPAQDFYKKWNSMTPKDQDAWIKEAPDANAKLISDELNKQITPGLSVKPSNELSKKYAEYEKDLNTHPDYTAVDLRNKAKAFQIDAFKTNYNNNVRDLYAEGGSSDYKALAQAGKIDKSQLDQAIDLDNKLYKAGLVGSLKFSKKFRESAGYAVPTTGGDGSGSGSSSSNAHLGDLIVNATKKEDVPTFSAKPRGIAFKSPVSTKGSSNNKKITIKL
jgi:uncharacterized membrane protein